MALSLLSKKFLRCVWSKEVARWISLSPVRLNEDESSKKSSAAQKLHSLLQDIIKEDSLSSDNTKKVAVEGDVVPKKKKRPEKPKNLGEKIVESAKQVAKGLDGKPEETEAQLLHRLLFKNKPLAESITKAAASESLKKLLSGMEVEKMPVAEKKRPVKPEDFTRAEEVRMMLGKRTSFKPRKYEVTGDKVDLFNASPFGLFKPEDFAESEVPMKTWEEMEKREQHLLVTHPPSNIFQQMIQWTERGILWKFPINNEQGLEEIETSDFTEHIFLENHLEGWCPDKGPIRHFMELVCVGLSRNHWLTAAEKKQHILWYKDYFTEKRVLLKELGAGDIKVLNAN